MNRLMEWLQSLREPEKPTPDQVTYSGEHNHAERTPLTLSELKKRVPVGSHWRHLARGSAYCVTGYCQLEATWEPGVLYVPIGADDPDLPIARSAAEFLDGRFTPWLLPHSPSSPPS